MLSEQTSRAESISVHLVHEWVGVLGQTRCEDDHLIVLGHDPQEIVDTWALLHKDLAGVAVDVDWYDKVWILYLIELTVYERLIQVQNKCFHSLAAFGWWSQQAPARLFLPFVLPSVALRNFDVTSLRF